jgi:hypothetical protein
MEAVKNEMILERRIGVTISFLRIKDQPVMNHDDQIAFFIAGKVRNHRLARLGHAACSAPE